MSENIYLKCTKCASQKPETEFSNNKRMTHRRGRHSQCKACQHERHKAWYAANHIESAERLRNNTIRWQQSNPLAYLLSTAKYRSKKSGLEFNLTVQDLEPAPIKCPILGYDLEYLPIGKGRLHHSASLDRIDNTKGYVKGNVIIISDRANRLKKDATAEELKKLSDFYNGLTVQTQQL